jgi:hypothetical protein
MKDIFRTFPHCVQVGNWEDTDIDGRIILQWIFRKWNGWHGLNLSG